MYLPSLNWGKVGAACFIIGSLFYTFCEVIATILEPAVRPWKCFNNIAAMRVLLGLIGNFNFLIGSIYFTPGLSSIVGIDIFVIGSIFLWIPQVLTCWGLYSCNHYTHDFYFAFYPWRNTVLAMNICMAFGCMLFVIGTVLFNDQPEETLGYY